MATVYTNAYDIGGMSRLYRGYLTYSVSYPSDTQAKITISYGAQMYEAYLYGVAATLTVDGRNSGTVEGYLSNNPGRKWTTIKNGTHTYTVQRGEQDRNVTLSVRAYGKTVNGIGSAGGSVSKTVTVKINKIPYVYKPHTNPTIDLAGCNNMVARPNEKTFIAAWRASEQGNAPFDRFSLHYSNQPNGNYTFILDSKSDDITHDFTQYAPNGGIVYVMLREHHKEKSGKEHYTQSYFQVNVDVPKVYLYDEQGGLQQGVVNVYDESGNRYLTDVFTYDKTGNISCVV